MDGELTELPMFACALDADAMSLQRDRYARVAASITGSRRAPGALLVDFDPATLDRGLLEEALAIERECCPFYVLRFEGARLSVGVAEPHQEPALDALAHLLGVGG